MRDKGGLEAGLYHSHSDWTPRPSHPATVTTPPWNKGCPPLRPQPPWELCLTGRITDLGLFRMKEFTEQQHVPAQR